MSSRLRRIAVIGVIVAIPLLIAGISQALSNSPGEPSVPKRVEIGGPGAPLPQPSPSPTASKSPSKKPVQTRVPPPPPVYDDDDDDDIGEVDDDDGDDD